MANYTRRDFLSILAGTAACALTDSLALAENITPLTKPARKTNVLFIAVDDLRPQLGCYGQKQILSPNIDRLASQGLLFERAYCQQAVCAPSRASLLSGLRPDSTKIYGLKTPLRKALPNVLSLPEHFKNNGYETLSIGKIYHHRNDDLQAWTEKPFRAGAFPKGKWKGRGYLTEQAIKQMREYAKENPSKAGRGPAYEAADVPDSAYPDGANTDHAIAQLNRLKDKPFFLAMGFHKPHLPFNAPKKYWDLYDPQKIKLAENPFIPKDAPDYALSNWGELRNYVGIGKKGPLSDDLARKLIHGYYACTSYIDAQIGRLIAELDRLNLRQNTVIILWGDHGWKLGEHAMWCKHTNFEIDTRAPLIISVPWTKAQGRRTFALTEFIDIYPTLCELTDLPLPPHLEGKSFVPLLNDPDLPWKKAAISQYPRRLADKQNGVMGYSMRTKNFRYTEWRHFLSGQVRAKELYDHKKDPHENTNVANDPNYKNTVDKLAKMLKDKIK